MKDIVKLGRLFTYWVRSNSCRASTNNVCCVVSFALGLILLCSQSQSERLKSPPMNTCALWILKLFSDSDRALMFCQRYLGSNGCGCIGHDYLQ